MGLPAKIAVAYDLSLVIDGRRFAKRPSEPKGMRLFKSTMPPPAAIEGMRDSRTVSPRSRPPDQCC